MKLLVSPKSVPGAKNAIIGGSDIIDCKNPAEGSLGANFPWVIKEMKDLVDNAKKNNDHSDLKLSATIGDMPALPGTAALAATGLASIGVDYIKIGVFGPKNADQAFKLLDAVRKAAKSVDSNIKVVAAGYADQERINTSIPPLELVTVAAKSRCDVVMVDTAIKDNKNLRNFMNDDQIITFCEKAKE
ncbi:MAG: (5-formylfuran-3-yl)methyl phosphate synthase, partial [Promethearchaeota archaeon]